MADYCKCTYKGTFCKPSGADTVCTLNLGFLTPAFVICSTNLEEGLVNLSRAMTHLDIARTVEEWHIPRNKQQLSEHTADHNDRPWSDWAVDIGKSWQHFSSSESPMPQLYRWNVPLLHMFTQHPGTSLHVTSLPDLPHISTASNKCWGEKILVHGYF